MGWTPPRTPEDVVRVSKILWAGLGDQMRESLGSSSDTESYGEEPFGASEEPAPDADKRYRKQ